MRDYSQSHTCKKASGMMCMVSTFPQMKRKPKALKCFNCGEKFVIISQPVQKIMFSKLSNSESWL